MGGELTASSEGVGRGATFTLFMPRWKELTDKNEPSSSTNVKSPEECFSPAKPVKPE
jgi:hypothetical protein